MVSKLRTSVSRPVGMSIDDAIDEAYVMSRALGICLSLETPVGFVVVDGDKDKQAAIDDYRRRLVEQ